MARAKWSPLALLIHEAISDLRVGKQLKAKVIQMAMFPPLPPRRLVLLGVVACFGTNFHFGYQLMLLNPTKGVLEAFLKDSFLSHYGFSIGDTDLATLWSGVLSLITLGAATSLVLLPPIANGLGRKKGLYLTQGLFLLATVPSVLGYTFDSFELFMVGRFLYGASCGVSSGLVALFLNEVSPRRCRGFLSALTGLFVEIGFFASSVAGLPALLGTKDLWPWLYVIEMGPTLLLLACLPWFPESPKFLLAKGRDKEAKLVLQAFEDDPKAIQDTLRDVAAELRVQAEAPTLLETLANRRIRPGLVAGCLVCCLMLLGDTETQIIVKLLEVPLSGILAINYFTTELMMTAGFTADEATLLNLVITACSIFAGVAGTASLDKFGRRPLLLAGNFLMLGLNCLFFAMFRTSEAYEAEGEKFPAAAYAFLVGSSLFMFFFAMGPGPIQWFITTEMVPLQFRAHASSLSLFFIYTVDFASGFIFFPLYTLVGSYAFFLFIVPLLIITSLLCQLLPETKNRSVKDITRELHSRSLCCGADALDTPEMEPILPATTSSYGT